MLSKNVDLNNTVILVTGAAGFVGANLVMSLLSEAEGTQIIGIDSVNDYYDVALKEGFATLLQTQMLISNLILLVSIIY